MTTTWQAIAAMQIRVFEQEVRIARGDATLVQRLHFEIHPATVMKGKKHSMFDPIIIPGDTKCRLNGFDVKHSYTVKEGTMRLTFCTEVTLP